ncbi:hypothetical protein C8R43DRAFT_944275 [Mycena crocata]|nr:hypothetical protein C8R43DRAFT_944275 [Mycena crocata]
MYAMYSMCCRVHSYSTATRSVFWVKTQFDDGCFFLLFLDKVYTPKSQTVLVGIFMRGRIAGLSPELREKCVKEVLASSLFFKKDLEATAIKFETALVLTPFYHYSNQAIDTEIESPIVFVGTKELIAAETNLNSTSTSATSDSRVTPELKLTFHGKHVHEKFVAIIGDTLVVHKQAQVPGVFGNKPTPVNPGSTSTTVSTQTSPPNGETLQSSMLGNKVFTPGRQLTLVCGGKEQKEDILPV